MVTELLNKRNFWYVSQSVTIISARNASASDAHVMMTKVKDALDQGEKLSQVLLEMCKKAPTLDLSPCEKLQEQTEGCESFVGKRCLAI